MPVIYLIESNENGHITYKIGKTRKRTRRRLKSLATGNAGKLRIVDEYHTDIPDELEIAVQNSFSYCRLEGEWFSDELEIHKFKKTCQIFESALRSIKKDSTALQ